MLKGDQLLKVVKAMAGANRSDLVRHCGYVSIRDEGQEHLHFAEFYGALLEATGVDLPGHPGRQGHPKSALGRDLSYSTHVHFNGNTDMLDLKPGDQFQIQLGQGQIRLVPLGAKAKGA